MELKLLTKRLSVSGQIRLADLKVLADLGFKTIINNRPDGEVPRQPKSDTLAARAASLGLNYHFIPVVPGQMTLDNVAGFKAVLDGDPGQTVAFCRTGTRSTIVWAKTQSGQRSPEEIIRRTSSAGYDLSTLKSELGARQPKVRTDVSDTQKNRAASRSHMVVIIGGGSAGIATAASLLGRRPNLDVAIIEPSEVHYYQPGWTMVGGGVFDAPSTKRKMKDLIPRGATWIKGTVASFLPDENAVELEDGTWVIYETLIAAPGLQLDYHKIEGASETLGKHGVTSNYLYQYAPYTWELVQTLKSGTAIFTQPPMPIKCAGAPQKAMYLSGDHWFRSGVLGQIKIDFCTAGGAIFGVKEYVPALMDYVKKYRAELNFGETLIKVDGPKKTAWFEKSGDGDTTEIVERQFDMLHITPPQSAPDFVKLSPLANADGWIDVDPETLCHMRYPNIYALGDACSAPNAKTMAAARKQAPVVATNVLATLDGKSSRAFYDGYGSCPLTVERGKIVLAEFGYGGKLLPSFPRWLINGTKPSRLSWVLKEWILPPVYWRGMLKGKEWLVKPKPQDRPEKEDA